MPDGPSKDQVQTSACYLHAEHGKLMRIEELGARAMNQPPGGFPPPDDPFRGTARPGQTVIGSGPPMEAF